MLQEIHGFTVRMLGYAVLSLYIYTCIYDPGVVSPLSHYNSQYKETLALYIHMTLPLVLDVRSIKMPTASTCGTTGGQT